MEKHNFKKKLGQNFIKDKNLLSKIISNIDIKEEDLVIEVGMGQGDLTDVILQSNPYYIGYEIDRDLSKYYKKYNQDKIKIFIENFLKADINDHLKDINYNRIFVVANLPYYITTSIINKVIDSKIDVDKMLIMVQKEVADRFVAKPKTRNYSSITVTLNYHFDVKKVLSVNRNSFIPKPNVDSEVLLFTKKENKEKLLDYTKFQYLLKEAFQFKRKNIKNNLFKFDQAILERVLIDNGFDLTSRAEELLLETFVQLANELNL